MNILGVLPYWTIGPWPSKPIMVGSVPLQIHSFGLCVAMGLLAAFAVASFRAEKKYGESGEEVQNYALWLLIIGWPLSHVFNVLFYEPHVLKDDPLELFRVWGSISSYGGFFGGVLAYLIYTFKYNKNRLKWADMSVFGISIPWFTGRIGCATVHDHPGALVHDFWLWEKVLQPIFGGPDLWPLAVEFPARSNLTAGPRHDLGFYEAIWWGLILIVIFWLDRKPRRLGFFAALIPILYAPGRFMFDFLRVPPEMGGDIRYFGLTPAQYFSIGIFVAGIIVWTRLPKEPMEWVEYDPNAKKGKKTKKTTPAKTEAPKEAEPEVSDETDEDIAEEMARAKKEKDTNK